ncbi:MAG TPA: peptidoglycan-binding domain-containing protein [Chthoniobacterales bacterium]|nr:peptidoglycan-binding domain-containing protein [Chthoniobacterales bacterium]
MKRVLFFLLTIGLCVGSVQADDMVRQLQVRLKNGGFYHGDANGVYDEETAVAVARYQIRNGLPISAEMDATTLHALGLKPRGTTKTEEPAPVAGAWRRLRNGDMQFVENANDGKIPPPKPSTQADHSSPQSGRARPAPPASTEPAVSTQASDFSDKERLREYVGAFILAGLDPQTGAELEFFADRVNYFGERNMSREKVRADLVRYARRWPERRFWLAGDIEVASQPDGKVQVTFPLRYELRNGSKSASGKVMKTLVLRQTGGNDLEIVEVSERKAG